MSVSAIGIDLAKNTFSLHGVDEHGKVFLKKTVSRNKLLLTLANVPPCLIGMEACSSSHYWARELSKLGHDVRIMAPKFVIPYRKGGKNDNNDAAAICEAVTRPDMRFVPVKSAEQQAVLSLHRIRQGLITQRTALINQLRGLLTEFGVVIPKGRYQTHDYVPDILEDGENGLPALARELINDVWQRYRTTCEEVLSADRKISALARESEQASRLLTIPGVGELVATAMVASVDPKQFENSRQVAAGSGSRPGSIRRAVISALGASPSKAITICECAWSMARVQWWPICATNRTRSAAGYANLLRAEVISAPSLQWRHVMHV